MTRLPEQAYKNLLDLDTRDKRELGSGICAYVEGDWNTSILPVVDREETSVWLKAAFKEWPHYSGDAGFPVPAPFGHRFWHVIRSRAARARAAYFQLPLWDGEYGAKRSDLLAFLVLRAKAERSVS